MDVGGKLKARHEVTKKKTKGCIILNVRNTLSELYLLLGLVNLQYAPEKFVETMKLMEHRYGAKEFVTTKEGILDLLAPGTYYLKEVDSLYRRFYGKKGDDGSITNGH